MPNGLSSAASALRYWERRQEVASNNLANASTDGFKAERVFAQMMGDALPTAQVATDAKAGSFRQTGNPLDVAIKNDGYLVVDTPNGERFSRGGSLQIDPSGRLTDSSGHPVLGEKGPITLPNGAVTINQSGVVSVNGTAVDRLRMERAGNPSQLAHEGGTLLVPDAGRTKLPDADRNVTQGFVEESNVNTVSSMVDMIAVQRAYASVQKAVTTMDAVRGTAVNELGKPV
jgi:flagellar basal-body rod protein FlgF